MSAILKGLREAKSALSDLVDERNGYHNTRCAHSGPCSAASPLPPCFRHLAALALVPDPAMRDRLKKYLDGVSVEDLGFVRADDLIADTNVEDRTMMRIAVCRHLGKFVLSGDAGEDDLTAAASASAVPHGTPARLALPISADGVVRASRFTKGRAYDDLHLAGRIPLADTELWVASIQDSCLSGDIGLVKGLDFVGAGLVDADMPLVVKLAKRLPNCALVMLQNNQLSGLSVELWDGLRELLEVGSMRWVDVRFNAFVKRDNYPRLSALSARLMDTRCRAALVWLYPKLDITAAHGLAEAHAAELTRLHEELLAKYAASKTSRVDWSAAAPVRSGDTGAGGAGRAAEDASAAPAGVGMRS